MPLPSRRAMCSLASLSAAALLLAGCSSDTPRTAAPAMAGISGRMVGGQQPVVGATIQLYAVGTTGDGSPATPLLTPAVITNSGGGFSLTGRYVCPSPNAQVYLLGTGGNPGLAPGTNNPQLALIAALGPCSALPAVPLHLPQ